ncbi:MAG: sigma-54-dependent Fis family transcriptional regulator [Acidobacteria bacterium]|nr:sigma-54-dependent Fis family transcriptional regulator [Acidobacteriota bacterium]
MEARGFRILRAPALEEAFQELVTSSPDLVIADLGSEDLEDPVQAFLGLLRPDQNGDRPAPLFILNSPERWGRAVEILKRAGAHFLSQPVRAEGLLGEIERALEQGGPAEPAPDQPLPQLPQDLIIGSSPAIQRVLAQVRLVAPKNTTVLISGETGTGKERISQAIHLLSHRRKLRMISVNCGGIPATLLEDEFFGHVRGAFTDAHQARMGRFEQAHRSTIFLDEIGDLPLELQPKLLRVLQEREIHRVGGVESIKLDVRVIAATNVDLWKRVAEGRFREDLFYRINVFPIHLPPLRERREDISLFIAHFLEKFCRRDNLPAKRLPHSAEADLMARPWPGNIRELEHAVEIAVIRSQDQSEVALADFPPSRGLPGLSGPAPRSGPELDFKGMMNEFEKDLILRVLEHTQGNRSQAAQILRLKRTTLLEKLKKIRQESGTAEEHR